MSHLSELAGARLQRIDGPHPDLIALTFHRADLHGVWLLSTAHRAVDWGWVPERPRGEPASSFVGLLRKHALNGRLVEVTVDAAGGTLVLRRGDSRVELSLIRRPANLIVRVDGATCGARRGHDEAAIHEATDAGPALPDTFEALTIRGPELVATIITRERETRRRALEKAIVRRRTQLRRRLRAIEGDLARVDGVEALRQRGSLLLAHLSRLPKDATEVVVTDWNADPPAPITIAIDPKRSPREEADHLFRRARKLERGGEIALERHAETEAALDALSDLSEALGDADEEALDRIAAAAAKLGAREQGAAGRRESSERRPYRAFEGHGGRTILVGRSAADNDALTLRHTKPWDHWLHARGVPGSHVVVPLDRDEACPPELLADAAHLAAHFSEMRGEPRVEVQHTPRRHVRKPRGAAPGAVTVQREKVLLLEVEPDRLRALLATGE